MDTYSSALHRAAAPLFAAALIASLTFLGLAAPERAAAQVQVEAMPHEPATSTERPTSAGHQDTSGFIYGRVETRRKTYTGRLRWGREESFWDDHLNGNRNQRPYLNAIPTQHRGERRPVEVFGVTFGSRWEAWSADRSIVVRYGDISRIDRRGRRHLLTMRSGSEVELRGGSNDLGGELTIWDAEYGEVEIDFQEVNTIVFQPTPQTLEAVGESSGEPMPTRLYGTVDTSEGTFHGFVAWDNEERLSTDILDGDDETGKRRKIPMSDIRQISRRTSSSASVELMDGTTLTLDGTNDVDSSNGGIFVEDPRFGRVEVPWRSFERVTFEPSPNSGRAVDDYTGARALRGTVETRTGGTLAGGIVYDVDESETWDFLNGRASDVRHNIPFQLIRSIERRDEDSSTVTLHDGTALTLDDSTDVGGRHAGVVVLIGDAERYVPWADVRTVSFERASDSSAAVSP